MENNTSILIVDDNPGITETLLDIFSDMGYDVAIANNGYRAIEIFKKKVFDFVLMDIKMLGLDGLQTFKKMHKINPIPKVIMMTAYSINEIKEEAYKCGVYDILDKPLDIEKVIKFINDENKTKSENE